MPTLADFQGGLDGRGAGRGAARALPAIAAYRDGGCAPHELPRDVLLEMMAFLALQAGRGPPRPMFFEDMQFDGADSRRRSTWGDEIPDDVKAASPVVVDRLRPVGHPRRDPPVAGRAAVHDRREERRARAARGGRTATPGARVDVGSHQYCYSFEPADHWSEYYCQQPELRDYFVGVRREVRAAPALPLRHRRSPRRRGTTTSVAWRVAFADADGERRRCSTARFVISAVGSLNIPKLPDIPGMETFAGPSFHSARWPDDLDLAGTRFALDRRRRQRLPDRARRSRTRSSS